MLQLRGLLGQSIGPVITMLPFSQFIPRPSNVHFFQKAPITNASRNMGLIFSWGTQEPLAALSYGPKGTLALLLRVCSAPISLKPPSPGSQRTVLPPGWTVTTGRRGGGRGGDGLSSKLKNKKLVCAATPPHDLELLGVVRLDD